MRILISKLAHWWFEWYKISDHPETVAIRNIIARNRKHRFVLLGEGDKFEHYNMAGIHFYNVGKNTLLKRFFSFVLKFELAIILRPSVIVSFGTTNIIPFGISSFLTRAKFLPVVTGEMCYAVQSMPRLFGNIAKLLLKIMFRKAHKILVLGEGIKNDLTDNYGVNPKKILIYKYRVSEIFNPKVGKGCKPFLNPNGPVVLTVCRISPEKGIDYLIEASRIFTKKIPNIKTIIVGSAGANAGFTEKKYFEKLTEMIREYDLQQHVSILNYVTHQKLPEYFSASDVFVLPSLTEGLPLVLLEALATGVPVVATSVGGIPDILINEENSLLVKPGCVEDLAEAIIKMLTEGKFRQRMIDNGLKFVRSIKDNEIETLLGNFILECEP